MMVVQLREYASNYQIVYFWIIFVLLNYILLIKKYEENIKKICKANTPKL